MVGRVEDFERVKEGTDTRKSEWVATFFMLRRLKKVLGAMFCSFGSSLDVVELNN